MAVPAKAAFVTISCDRTIHHQKLVNGLWERLQAKRAVDFDVEWGGRSTRVHRLLLDVFLAPDKLIEPPSSSGPELDGSQPDTEDGNCSLDALLEFLYRGRVTVRREQLANLLAAARWSEFELLVDVLESSAIPASLSGVVDNSESATVAPKVEQGTTDPTKLGQRSAKSGPRHSRRLKRESGQHDPEPPDSNHDSEPDSDPRDADYKLQKPAKKRGGASLPGGPPRKTRNRKTRRPRKCNLNCVEAVLAPDEHCYSLDQSAETRVVTNSHHDPPPLPPPSPAPVEPDPAAADQDNRGTRSSSSSTTAKLALSKPFKCHVCKRGFVRRDRLIVHQLCHGGQRPYKCGQCEDTFSRPRFMERHMLEEHGADTVCLTCGLECGQPDELRRHAFGHVNVERPYKCEVCGKTFARRNNLAIHEKSHQKDRVPKKRPRPYKCGVCGQSFAMRYSLANHARTHDGEPHRYQCPTCHKTFTQSQSLLDHGRIHTGEKPFVCEECGMAFRQSQGLKRHSLQHGDKPHKCEVCSKGYPTSDSLKVHMRIHTGEKPYMCDLCGTNFSKLYTLIVHRAVHLTQKPHSCKICGKAYAQKQSLQKHAISHLDVKPTVEKRYKCDECGSAFATRGTLIVHVRQHTGEKPFQCQECNRSFTQQQHLKSHMRTHSGEKPHTCSICNKSFSQKQNCQAHFRTHFPGRPSFDCDICHKSFPRPDKLRKHLETHNAGPHLFG